MASNELAAILARRRAKAGGESEPPVPSVELSSPPAPAAAPRSSIAERIARLKQQSAAASAGAPAPAPAPAPATLRFNHPAPASEPSEQLQASSSSVGSEASVASAVSEPADTSAVAAAQEAAGLRRASNKIQQLQGSLGINVNPFGRPGGPSSGGYKKPSTTHRESIMSTGEEQYGHTQHAMGVAMPGMTGSAIPMPGLAKGGFRLPGMAPQGEQNAEAPAPLDDSHATMNRVAGPKRRGPTRPPPGAFRIPTMAAPIIDDVEPAQVPASEVAVAAAPTEVPTPAEAIEPKAVEAMPAPAANLFSSPAPTPAYSPALAQAAPVSAPASTPVSAPVAASLQKLPEPELMPSMKPYELEDDPFAPVYDTPSELPYAPTGFPSALLANFSMDELSLDDNPKPTTATSTLPATSASNLFGVSSPVSETPVAKPSSPPPAAPVEAPKPVPTPVYAAAPAPVSERVHSPTPMSALAPMKVVEPEPTPAAVSVAPTPSPAPAPVVSSPAPTPAPAPVFEPASAPVVYTPAPAPTPTPAPAPVFAPAPTPAAATPAPIVSSGSSYLFGAAAAANLDDDDSSESDWSDDDHDGGNQSLFGAQSSASAPTTAPATVPVLVTPAQTTPELHQAPAVSGSLFGDVSSSPAPAAAVAPAPGFVKATPQTAVPPTPYSSLFSGAVSSSSESESDSDDEGGLFGTGVPSKR